MHYMMTSPKTLAPEKELDPPVIAEVPDDEKIHSDRLISSACNCPDVNNISFFYIWHQMALFSCIKCITRHSVLCIVSCIANKMSY